jgi:membrane protease YdiL (CAAX protease family)
MMLGVLTCVALLITGIFTQLALRRHMFGVTSLTQALTDVHYTLGSMGCMYVFTLALSYFIFPLFWQKSLFAGLQWREVTAFRLRRRLIVAAVACFILAVISGIFMPGPQDTPIDKIFRTPGAAWLMFVFGVTFAPFFEEIVFRGFLLPALCTAYDWIGERAFGEPSHGSDENGHPQWSIPAMVVGSLLTSLPFAVMHGEQTGWAVGPLLLLVCVSLVLCWARLATRSLAASVLVHACYNFLLFSMMMLGTGGFRHLDKM